MANSRDTALIEKEEKVIFLGLSLSGQLLLPLLPLYFLLLSRCHLLYILYILNKDTLLSLKKNKKMYYVVLLTEDFLTKPGNVWLTITDNNYTD